MRIDLGEAVGGWRRVQIHQLRQTAWDPVGDAGNDDPAAAVPDQHDVTETLVLDEIHDVGNVGLEVDLRAGQVRPFAQAGERDRIYIMPPVPQLTGNALPAPAPQPEPRNQNKRGHAKVLFPAGPQEASSAEEPHSV